MTKTTTTTSRQLDRISAVIDTFCTNTSNFIDDDNISKLAMYRFVGLLDRAADEIGYEALNIYLGPRLAIVAGTQAEVMTYFFAKLKKGTPPHLSRDEVCGMLMAHSEFTVAVEEHAFEEQEASRSSAPMPTRTLQ
jgi:hypothetical protein